MERETFKGLTEEIIHRDNGRPFEVSQLRCLSCGLKDDYQDDETRCHRCGHELDKTRKTARDIHINEVKDIIDTQLVYKCPTCKKIYDKPTLCCNQEQIQANPTRVEKYSCYLCTGCGTYYKQPVKCCSGSMMVKGDLYPEPTVEVMNKVKAGLIQPITGMMQ